MDKRDLLVIDNVLIPDMEQDRLKIYEKDLDRSEEHTSELQSQR